jgi:hypothetical protein
LILVVSHDNASRRVNGYAPGLVEESIVLAQAACREEKGTRAVEDLDAMVVCISDEGVVSGVYSYPPRKVELSIASAPGAPANMLRNPCGESR